MPAAVLRGRGRLEVEDVPVPALGDHEVLVEVSHCGVCGSDLHMVIEGWGRKGSIGGHEWSGVIVGTGGAVTGWAVGDEIVGGPTPRCGTCEPCRAGRPSLCTERDTPGMGGEFQGAFARYVKVDERELLRVPDGLSLREAALAEPLAVALHGITLSGIQAGERALVTGAGPIGALVIAALKAMGVDDIKVSARSELRRTLAESLGASEVVTAD
jgi:threonine dehydrogenase-like Zn-dependent dehydrogenase